MSLNSYVGNHHTYTIVPARPISPRKPSHKLSGHQRTVPSTSSSSAESRLASPCNKFRISSPLYPTGLDTFWSQPVVNEWNIEYSPRKLLFPRPNYDNRSSARCTSPHVSPSVSPSKSENKSKSKTRCEAAHVKRAFEANKTVLAEQFLRELDEQITYGKIGELAAPCGGVKIVWSKKLNSTAGRANWKRESVKTISIDGTWKTTFQHHACIELAEKVIDDEGMIPLYKASKLIMVSALERLTNVIAHEFCHLANFMISGIRDNPHGKEFKKW